VKVLHTFGPDSAVFDDDNLVSCAGLVPVMALAERTGLSDLLAQNVQIAVPRIKSGSANPAPKLATLIAGMCAGADSIDDVDVLRSGGMKSLFGGVYAPSTVGTLLREFTFGHARQLDITHRRHAIIETTFADLIDGPLAHMPSGRFGANSAWVLCAGIAHNLLRAIATLAGPAHAVARGATLRRKIVNIAARLARPQRRPILHLPSHWPWTDAWLALWRNVIEPHPPPRSVAA
jgi:hypothetical protein